MWILLTLTLTDSAKLVSIAAGKLELASTQNCAPTKIAEERLP
jgi:hypothetical protein